MLLPMASVGIPNRGHALRTRNILILVVLVLATLAATTGFADPTLEAIVEPPTPGEPEVEGFGVGVGVESTTLTPKAESESVAELASSQTPALVQVMTEVGRSWTYVYVRERTRTLTGGEPKVETSRGTRVDQITGLAPEFGEGVVRLQSSSRGRAASSPSEEHAGFYRVADSSYQLVAEQIYDPTSGVAALVRYDVPLSVLETGAQPGQRWSVGVRSQADLHTDLEGEVLGVQDVQTPHGLFERCLVIRLTGQISGVVEAYGSRMEVPSGDFTVTRWYAPGIGLVLAKEEFSQILVLEDGTQMDYSERTQFALRSTESPGAAAPAPGEP